MFFATYKNTLKTLLRSTLFWIAVLLVLFIVIERAVAVQSAMNVVVGNEIVDNITDTEPEYRQYMDHNHYVQVLQNSQSFYLISYGMPLFAVVTTMLVLTRDYADNLFEIEKAAGTSLSKYFLGRLTALISVNFIFCLIFGHVGFHTFFYSRGGPPDFFSSNFEYFIDSSLRILRVFVGAEIFTILFFICITYAAVTLLRSGLLGGICGIISVLFVFGETTFIRHRLPELYLNYFTPHSVNHYCYLGFYDSEAFNHPLANPFDLNDVFICVIYLFCISVVFLVISYLSTRRRTI